MGCWVGAGVWLVGFNEEQPEGRNAAAAVRGSIHLSIYLSIHLSIHLSIYLCISIYTYINIYMYGLANSSQRDVPQQRR